MNSVISYIVDGKVNPQLDLESKHLCELALKEMELDSSKDRLSVNYAGSKLNLNQMDYYSLLFNEKDYEPVMWTGAQRLSENVCRLFSRYYLFSNYRTLMNDNLYNKVDDFETDMYHKTLLSKRYNLFIWSRDKGNGFFKRIKKARPDVFHDWSVHPDMLPIRSKQNVQGIFYCGDEKYLKEITC